MADMAEPKSAAHAGDDEPARAKKSAKKAASGSSSSKKSSSSAAVSDPSAVPSMSTTATTPATTATPPATTASGSGPTMGPSHLSAAPATATPVPKLHDVPRIPIAEPKLTPDAGSVGAGEAKPRASKKRTTTPPSGPDEAATGARQPVATASGGSAPTVDAAAVAKQDADAEREKQAAAVRREAKRQRAKEIEEAKRRDELAKQALEEAKQKEEARLREQRRQKELAALNANAEECQEEDEQADYDDDCFENYEGDDFEDDDKPPEKNPIVKPQAKAKSKGTSNNSNNNNNSATGDDALNPAALKKIQQAMQAESKELSTSRPSSSSSKGATASASDSNQERPTAAEAKKRSSTSIASSIAGLKQALDPRAKRVKEVLEARKFEVEKFNLFHQAPLSEQETYLSALRRGQVRQVAVYTNDGAKSTQTQTKYPAGVDKSMHFPDDIGLDSASSTTSVVVNGRQQSVNGSAGDDDDDSGASARSSVRFFKFLESAAYACELLAESNAMTAEQALEESSESTKKRLAVTAATKLVQQHVIPNKHFDDAAVEKLLHGRDLVAMRFSPCVSNILVTCYGSHETAMGKENAAHGKAASVSLNDKSVSCVWDVNQPHQALYVLKNEGVISSVCLSPSRELIVLAGTEDGSIHVWDLRHQSYRSSSSTSCSPTYSTCGVDYKTPSQHTSTIVALDVIDQSRSAASGSASGSTFQFGSMDDRGIVIIWSLIEFEAGEDALIADKCVEIGGRVKMVMNTLIDTQQQYMLPKQPKRVQRSASSSSSGLTAKSSSAVTAAAASSAQTLAVGPIAAVFKFFPHDPNQFVVGTQTGVVYRGHRFEKTERSQMRMQYRRKGATSAMAAVVCIDFHPFTPEYFLVGYEDGSVCLFRCSAAVCVSSWEEVPFGVSVSALQWSTSRPGVFFAAYSNAQVLVWDLTEQTNAPVFAHAFAALEAASPVELASSLYPLVLSSEAIRASRPTIALRCGDSSPFQFALMELSQELTTRAKDEDRDVKVLLTSIL